MTPRRETYSREREQINLERRFKWAVKSELEEDVCFLQLENWWNIYEQLSAIPVRHLWFASAKRWRNQFFLGRFKSGGGNLNLFTRWRSAWRTSLPKYRRLVVARSEPDWYGEFSTLIIGGGVEYYQHIMELLEVCTSNATSVHGLDKIDLWQLKLTDRCRWFPVYSIDSP